MSAAAAPAGSPPASSYTVDVSPPQPSGPSTAATAAAAGNCFDCLNDCYVNVKDCLSQDRSIKYPVLALCLCAVIVIPIVLVALKIKQD